MSTDLALAEFIDGCLQRFPKDKQHFLLELDADYLCPSDHKHDETPTCYVHHHCRCRACRAAMKRRRRANRAYNQRRRAA